MKNAPVIVIRNRDEKQSKKYRIRNLVTNEITYSDDVTLDHAYLVPNVDNIHNLEPERVIHCNWAVGGTLCELDKIRKLPNKYDVETFSFGFKLIGNARNSYYYEEDHGPLRALHFGANENDRFVCLESKWKK